jgi:type IV secretory pathway TraG/TraD family ATPase VirD4
VGILAAIKRLAFSFLVTFNWAYSFFTRRSKLHGSRFARIDELTNLTTHALDKEGSLIIGVSHLNHVLRVKPVKTRRELGNMLVVAPTRGGKGLLATAQLLTWRHSVVVNDIKGDLFAQTAGYRSKLGPGFVDHVRQDGGNCRRSEVAISHAACGGICIRALSVRGTISSTMPSICM